MIKAATDVLVAGKRKASELKEGLTKLGFSFRANERKGVLLDKYNHACALLALRLADEDHTWTREEYDILTKGLVDRDTNDWDAGEVYLIRSIYSTRFFSCDVMADEGCTSMITKIEQRYNQLFSAPIKQKTEVISANSIAEPMKQLLRKPVANWGDKEGELLVTMFGNVKGIDARSSTDGNLDNYRRLNEQLCVFYIKRPDIKQKVDPEVVTFDLSGAMEVAANNAGGAAVPAGANAWLAAVAAGGPGTGAIALAAVGVIDLYNRSLALYPAINFPVPAPAAAAALPGKTNPGPVSLTFVFNNVTYANHFIGWMQHAVPGLQATVTSSPNVPIIYN
eukprot:CAMPEP_0170366198 /NCGR_PEP_ID=MMETSP0117_2-20130122/6293_1 /TAXON_ID=400756 /ORGANISM="Durinskia baltica, Strain CSIRO CS-38" /LENGTH=336 /DNA_ID=CAMNT_0010620777 /DNA_START=17 /DNA_END=1027 /DNA_ORIENTATION=-